LNVEKGWNLQHRNSTSGSLKKTLHKIYQMETPRMFLSISNIVD